MTKKVVDDKQALKVYFNLPLLSCMQGMQDKGIT